MRASHRQRQGGCGYCNGEQSHRRNKDSLTCVDLWHWLIDHGAPRGEIERKLTKFLLVCKSRKDPGPVNKI